MKNYSNLADYPFKTLPYAHQLSSLRRSLHRHEYAYFLEMGLGKSKVLLDNAAILFDEGKIDALVIVTPKGNLRNWDKLEIPKHLPDHVNRNVLVWQPNHTKQWRQAYNKMVKEDSEGILNILTVNVEAFSTKKGCVFVENFLNVHHTMMAVDESTLIKNPKAQRTKNLLKMSVLPRYKRILTGFPVTKAPLDLYSQCAFLSPRLLGFSSYYAFRARYAVVRQRNLGRRRSFQEIVDFQRLDELQAALGDFSVRYTKDECLDLPEKVYMKREVELSEEQKKAYGMMKKEALMIIEDNLFSTQSVLTQLMRLQQVVAGSLRNADGETVVLANNRVKETVSLLEETGGKVIVFAVFQTDIEELEKAIGKQFGRESVASFYGKTSNKRREEVLEAFQDPDSELRFFVSNPHTGGRGLTLTAADTMIFYSNSYDLELRLQAEDRIHRIGQDNRCTYVDLVAPGTVDTRILDSLRKKIKISNEVLGEVKEWFV